MDDAHPLAPAEPELSDEEIARVRGILARVVSATCPTWLSDRREDITQGALVRLVRAATRVGVERIGSSGYLWRIAHSAVLDELQAARRRSHEKPVDPATIDGLAKPGTGYPQPERAASSSEIGRAIRDCLTALIDPRRHVVTLNLLGYGLTEIAKVLGQKRKRIDNLLYRGMDDLRACLDGKGVRP